MFAKKISIIAFFTIKFYNTSNNTAIMSTILHTIVMEFIALESPTSPFKSPVYATADAGSGATANIISANRTSFENGKTKNVIIANNIPTPYRIPNILKILPSCSLSPLNLNPTPIISIATKAFAFPMISAKDSIGDGNLMFAKLTNSIMI